MLEIGINLAMTLKTLMGCLTSIYVVHTIVDLIKTTPIKLPELKISTKPLNSKLQQPKETI